MPGLLNAGYATFGQNSRWLNNDIACIHETLLLDIAAGIKYLREQRGFKKVILCGNSGGGGLYSFYQAQAETSPPNRLQTTPAGDPPNLNEFNLPKADGLILMAAHVGQGKFLLTTIDPAVVDENDPMATDASLDMYNPKNGFRNPPEESRYSAEFLSRYREAQRERVRRLDAIAHSSITEQTLYKGLLADPLFERDPSFRPHEIARRASLGSVMRINRTDANPAYCDLSLNPSRRGYGSLISSRPDLSNYAFGGFAGILTPRAWLSTWSGLSSRAGVVDNLPSVTVPTLIVYYDGDNAIFPDDIEAMMLHAGTSDKAVRKIAADHYGLSLDGAHSKAARTEAGDAIASWLNERF
jgi:pimeloyl-ACP methyl ester carboxylesterase